MKNVQKKENFNQVVIWPGTIVKPERAGEFETWMLENMGIRVQYLEEILTKPDVDENGNVVPGTGDRNDLFFAVHEDDISKFAVARLQFGMRWIEDAMSNINGYFQNPIYPDRVAGYKTWEA